MENITQTIDYRKVYTVGHITIKFNAANWEWMAHNHLGFGIYSDMNLDNVMAYVNEYLEENN